MLTKILSMVVAHALAQNQESKTSASVTDQVQVDSSEPENSPVYLALAAVILTTVAVAYKFFSKGPETEKVTLDGLVNATLPAGQTNSESEG